MFKCLAKEQTLPIFKSWDRTDKVLKSSNYYYTIVITKTFHSEYFYVFKSLLLCNGSKHEVLSKRTDTANL